MALKIKFTDVSTGLAVQAAYLKVERVEAGHRVVCAHDGVHELKTGLVLANVFANQEARKASPGVAALSPLTFEVEISVAEISGKTAEDIKALAYSRIKALPAYSEAENC